MGAGGSHEGGAVHGSILADLRLARMLPMRDIAGGAVLPVSSGASRLGDARAGRGRAAPLAYSADRAVLGGIARSADHPARPRAWSQNRAWWPCPGNLRICHDLPVFTGRDRS